MPRLTSFALLFGLIACQGAVPSSPTTPDAASPRAEKAPVDDRLASPQALPAEPTAPAPSSPQGEPKEVPAPACVRPENRCASDDARCLHGLREAWRSYRLSCTPVEPPAPIAGESVRIWVPNGPNTGPGRCTTRGHDKRLERRGGRTTIHVTLLQQGRCGDHGGIAGLDLGVLSPGKYTVDTGTFRRDFEVRPEGSDPGDLTPAEAARLAVALQRSPGVCFGMPGAMPHRDRRFATSRRASKLRMALPSTSEEELAEIDARMGKIAADPAGGPGTWTYSYVDGQCCNIHEVRGEVTETPTGHVVSPPRIVSTSTVPC